MGIGTAGEVFAPRSGVYSMREIAPAGLRISAQRYYALDMRNRADVHSFLWP